MDGKPAHRRGQRQTTPITRGMDGKQAHSQQGLTLIELLITIAVLAIISAIAAPVLINQVEASRYNALIRSLHEVTTFITKWDNAGAVIVEDGDHILHASFPDTPDAEQIESLDGYSLAGTGTEADPYMITLTGSSAPYPVISYQSTGAIGADATYTRTATSVTLNFPRANWQALRITYDPGSGYQNLDLLKSASNDSVVGGIVTKISNTEIRIDLPTSTSFALDVTFNGGSTGKFFFI